MKLSIYRAVFCLTAVASVDSAHSQDIFGTDRHLPLSVVSPVSGETACFAERNYELLTLREAVELALCNHPKTRVAWAQIKEQAAALGSAESAFLPTVTVTGQEIRDGSDTTVQRNPYLDSRVDQTTYTASASLSWLLYDFGAREAGLDEAESYLAAALANHDDVLQTVFLDTAKDYLSAVAALAAREAAAETEQNAKGSIEATTERANKGVAPVSDQLQAETAFIQAKINSQKADGDWLTAIGTLAADLGQRPDAKISLPAIDPGAAPAQAFEQQVSSLIDGALRRHPKILMAEAQLKAAEASVSQTQAAGWPSVSFVAKSSRDNHGVAAAQGLPLNPAVTQDNYVGVEITIPLFEGFARSYKVRQATAQREAQAAALDDVKRQVSQDVWMSFHLLQTATQNAVATARLLDTAQQSYVVAKRRYENGAGSILELLNTQSALANARRQRIQALTDWRASRIELAVRLGEVDINDI